jgi:hypothetical protein
LKGPEPVSEHRDSTLDRRAHHDLLADRHCLGLGHHSSSAGAFAASAQPVTARCQYVSRSDVTQRLSRTPRDADLPRHLSDDDLLEGARADLAHWTASLDAPDAAAALGRPTQLGAQDEKLAWRITDCAVVRCRG